MTLRSLRWGAVAWRESAKAIGAAVKGLALDDQMHFACWYEKSATQYGTLAWDMGALTERLLERWPSSDPVGQIELIPAPAMAVSARGRLAGNPINHSNQTAFSFTEQDDFITSNWKFYAGISANGQVWGEAEVGGTVIVHGPELDVGYKLANGTFVGDQSFPEPAATTYSSEPTLDALPATYTIAWAVGRLAPAVVSAGGQAAAGLYAAPGTPRTDPYNPDWRLDTASGDVVPPPPLASATAFCVWKGGSGITQLFSGGKPDQNTVAMCIANDGTMVGTSDLLTPKHPADPGNAKHLFVAIAGSSPLDIYNFIPPSLLGQVRIESALDISSDGTKILLKGQTLEGGSSPAWVPRTLLLARDEQKLCIVDAKGASPMKINNSKVLAGYIPKPSNVISAGILLPVEIVDKDKKSVNKLKVAKMVEPGVLSGSSATTILNPDKDSDRFYLRVVDPSQRGKKPKVRFWTENDDDTRYSDQHGMEDNIIELDDDPTNPSGLISKSLLLVSDRWDDECKVDGFSDDAYPPWQLHLPPVGRAR